MNGILNMSKRDTDIIERYRNGTGTCELAQFFELSRSTIQRTLLKNGINLRKRSCSNKYDMNFFSKYNESSCYWAGFIAADGNLRSDRHEFNIHLSTEDYSHLVKFANAIHFTGDVCCHNTDCRISLSGKEAYNDLINKFGLMPRKTKCIKIPERMPLEFTIEFIRGYFDGDGCITYSGKNLHISFTSGSLVFLLQVIDYFYARGIVVRNSTGKPPVQRNVQVHYYMRNAMKVLNMLYGTSNVNRRLDRKYRKYLNGKVNNV